MPEVNERLRTEAAKLGADVVVIVVDPQYLRGTVASRMWSERISTEVTGRDVIGVAVKYT